MTVDLDADFETLRGIRRVAVIGAGASGCPAARHLREHGLQVRVFERQPHAGGIWSWSPDVARLAMPTPPPSKAAFDPESPETDVFSPPNPVYANLSNNVPTSTMVFKDFPYPPNTAENVRHDVLAAYIRNYASHFDLSPLISYDTRVERATKAPRHPSSTSTTTSSSEEWTLRLRHKSGHEWTESFDALVVATGHYNAPFVPRLPGLQEWVDRWPEDVFHTTAYRYPETYAGKTVLIVGLGTSGLDIARDIVAANNEGGVAGPSTTVGLPSPPTPSIPAGAPASTPTVPPEVSSVRSDSSSSAHSEAGASTPPTSPEAEPQTKLNDPEAEAESTAGTPTATSPPTASSDPASAVDPSRRSTILISARDPYGPSQYQAQRNAQRRLAPGQLLPEISEFLPPAPGRPINEAIIRFEDGSERTGVDTVIFATGYQYSFPFLSHLHKDPGPKVQVDGEGEGEGHEASGDGDANGSPLEKVEEATTGKGAAASEERKGEAEWLVTDGKGVHHLYRDVFYVPDPSLSFVGISVNTSAFAFFEYQSLSVARVFSGRARLPSLPRRRELHEQWLQERGGGKFAHLMGSERERAYVRETVGWLNEEAERTGDKRVEGHSKEWLEASDRFKRLLMEKWKLGETGP